MVSQMINKIEQMIESGVVRLFKTYPQVTPKILIGSVVFVGWTIPLAIRHWPLVVLWVASYIFINIVSPLPGWLEKLKAAANGVETIDPIDVTPTEEK